MPTTKRQAGADRWFTFKSRSNPDGRKHTVHVEWLTGRVTCSCPGWTYRQKCWHVDHVIDHICEVGYEMRCGK